MTAEEQIQDAKVEFEELTIAEAELDKERADIYIKKGEIRLKIAKAERDGSR